MDAKALLIIGILVVLVVALIFFQPPAAEPEPSDDVTIYIYIVTHNEEPDGRRYPDFTQDEDAFWGHRAAVVEFADMLHEEGVPYNYQSDWNFLLAATMFDNANNAQADAWASTNNKNFLRYLKEDLGFEIDPHAHESQYNYADVAYLIKQLGVEPSGIVGGFLAYPPEDAKTEYFRDTLIGRQYPNYSWDAEVLWGGATSSHAADYEVAAYGIWRPKDNENFLIHDPSAPLPHIGSGTPEMLIRAYEAGELESGKIYTAGIFVAQYEDLIDTDGFAEKFKQRIDSLREYGDLIQLKGLGEIIEIWGAEYDSEGNIYQGSSGAEQPPGEDPRTVVQKGSCGDGVCDEVEARVGACPQDCN